jgi:hypothetical protein
MNPRISSNKSRLEVPPHLAPAIAGLKLFSIKNKENSYIVPSTKNFLNDMQIRCLKIDQGATVSFFPILHVTALNAIFTKFPQNRFIYSITPLRTFSGEALALQIQPVASHLSFKFNVYLGCDIYPADVVLNLNQQFELAAQQPISELSLPALRPIASLGVVHFFLSTEDVNVIRANQTMMRYFDSVDSLNVLRDYNRDVPRRQNGLIGNDILEKFGSIKYQRVELFFDVALHRLESTSWDIISRITKSVLLKRYLRDNVDVDELNMIGPSDIIFEESEEFDVIEDAKDV